MAESTAKVSVEKIIHTQLRTLAENLESEYGLLLEHVHFRWAEGHKIGKPGMIGELLNITTEIKG